MYQKAIMVFGADLRRVPESEKVTRAENLSPTSVIAGSETARVCRKAATIAVEHPDAYVYATAGFIKKFGVMMGAGPMRRELINAGIDPCRICTPEAETPNTDGEARALVKDLEWEELEIELFTIYAVCRWFHVIRAVPLIWACLGSEQRLRTRIVWVPVWTFFDPLSAAKEPLAWVKNSPRLIKAF